MKYRKFLYIFISAYLLLIGCVEKKTVGSQSEPGQVSLESVELIHDSLLVKPNAIAITDDAIVVSNSATIDGSLINIFNLNGDFVRSCMTYGEGPMEALDVADIQYDATEHCLYVMDTQFNSYKVFRITDYLNPTISIKDVFSFSAADNDSIMLSGGAVYLSNGEIVAGNVNPAGMVAIFNDKGDPIRLFGKVPDKNLIDSRLTDFGNSSIYHQFVGVSPKCDFAAFYYDVSDMCLLINVIDKKTEINYVEGKPATGIYPSEMAPGVCVGAVTDKTFWHTQGVSLSNKYIYQLYVGLLLEDFYETDFFKDSKRFGANTVNVYDREGNHLKTLTLDRWATTLAVSPDDKYLYTLTQSSTEGYTLLRYAL